MLEFFTGVISGAFSGIGMGGGTILILILSVFLGINQHIAQASNLIFFIPTSITAIITTMKEKLINWGVGVPVAVAGVIGSIFGSRISVSMDVKILRRCFGIFLSVITIYEIYSLIKEYKRSKKINNKSKGKRKEI